MREKSVIVLLAVGIFLAGVYSWGQLRQELLPDIELPFVTVITPLPGAGAEDVASQVTEPIERALANVPRLETMQSTSSNSLSLVFAQFDFGTDLKETIDAVERAIGQVAAARRASTRRSAPSTSTASPSSWPPSGLSRAPTRSRRRAIAREEVVPALLGIEGVSTAELTGGATPILDIVLDPETMAENGISLQQVQGILMANQITLPVGSPSTRATCACRSRPSTASPRSRQLEAQIVGASTPAGAAAGPGAMAPPARRGVRCGRPAPAAAPCR